MFKIKKSLPDFSRACTAKEKVVMINKNLRLLQYSWILNHAVPVGGLLATKKHQQPIPSKIPMTGLT